MAKNLMPEVAKLLGVEIGEVFRLKNSNSRWRFKFAEDVLLGKFNNFEWSPAYNVLDEILDGTFEIVKLQWEPKERDVYWTMTFYSDGKPFVEDFVWYGDIFDCAKKALGIVYRTKAEAEAHLEEDYKRLTGRKLEG